MSGLVLGLRTPVATLFDGPVRSVRAEDLDGWFGIRPGRRDLVAVLPAGLLLFEDAAGDEHFVALEGGLLDLREQRCRVMARGAVLAFDLDAIAKEVEAHLRSRRDRPQARRDVFHDLAREALRRLLGTRPEP